MIETLFLLGVGAFLGEHFKISSSEKAQRFAGRLIDLGVAKIPVAANWATEKFQQIGSSDRRSLMPSPMKISEAQLEEIVSTPEAERSDTIATVLAAIKNGRANEIDSL